MPKPMRDPGKEESFAASLFNEYAEMLHRFLRRRMGSTEDADDVFQTIFERLSRMPKAERVQKPQAFLFGIAFHVVREHRMKSNRWEPVLSFDSDAAQAASEKIENAQDDEAERLIVQEQLERALARLPGNHRRVLLAVRRDGMSHEEAAAATGISVRLVRKYLVEAKLKLMEMSWDR
jgi:RNA polymerase sigma-70 factor (ECF subfamily)